MDKVIIDGIDVSECKNFIPVYTEDTDIEINNCCTLTYTPCQFEKKDCYYKQLKRLKHYQAEFEHELMNDYTYDGYISPNGFTPIDVIKHIKAELKKYEDMAKKGLDEFKDVGGCWGCGLQLQLNQDMEYIKQLKAENERLKANKGRCAFKCLDNTFCPEADKKITELELSRDSYKVSYETAKKYREKAEQCLQEIREIAGFHTSKDDSEDVQSDMQDILDKINEVIGAE